MRYPFLTGVTGGVLLFSQISVATADDPLTVVITASRGAQTVDETMAPVTIIDRERIEQSGKNNVADVLTTVPGLVVTNSGGPGKTTSVFMRGTESDHVLVLIDGVKVGSASLGTTPFENITLSSVEKIEAILKRR